MIEYVIITGQSHHHLQAAIQEQLDKGEGWKLQGGASFGSTSSLQALVRRKEKPVKK